MTSVSIRIPIKIDNQKNLASQKIPSPRADGLLDCRSLYSLLPLWFGIRPCGEALRLVPKNLEIVGLNRYPALSAQIE